MNALANLNGEIMPLTEAKVPALDRGFLFGDAVYEVLRIYQGKPFLMREHFDRFARSLASVRITGVDLARLQKRMLDTVAAGPFQEAIAYLQITRGVAPRKHPFPEGVAPLEFLYVQEFRDPYAEERKAGAAVVTHPDVRWDRCDIKSTNLLANVLAAQAARETGCVEALLTLPDGTLTEGTHTSFFSVLDGSVLTTPKGNAILPGITRGLVLRLAKRAGIPVREQSLKKSDLPHVSELFLTGTTSEVLPVVRVDDHAIGDGKPGKVTRRLQEEYQATVRELIAGG
jgi:D-alanine transaminase